MKLLIVTQVVDTKDPVLGFFHEWIRALAVRFEGIVVICLKEGSHDLPQNVHVYSLGKEKGSVSALAYATRFLSLAWKLRHEYDRVFVHMNQEYILIAGWLWEILNKKVYMWRNHYAGSWLTDLAASTCTKVFCTSKHSYTAKYKKTLLMPVGVDLERFGTNAQIRREPHSVLFLARISPSKHPDIFIEALSVLVAKSVPFAASLYGSPLPDDVPYYESLTALVQERGLRDRVRFFPGIPNSQTPEVYQAHEIFVNCSQSGMFDKTLFEAAASGCLVLASSLDFKALAGDEYHFSDAAGLADKLRMTLAYSDEQRRNAIEKLQTIASQESLGTLMDGLAQELTRS
jgi:glycosyltransferase involved in cell wall biosynthesis